jgi:lipopolysaccharide transport system permease protein
VTQLSGIYRFRGFIFGSVNREFASRYRNSMLGAAWPVLQPLAQILVFTLISSQVMRAWLPGVDSAFGYSIFLCSGILTWGVFAEIVGRSQNVFLDNANLLKDIPSSTALPPHTAPGRLGIMEPVATRILV